MNILVIGNMKIKMTGENKVEYIYVGEKDLIISIIYDFERLDTIKAIFKSDEQTVLIARYDWQGTLFDLQVESRVENGATNLMMALFDFCYYVRNNKSIVIHKVVGTIVPTDSDSNRIVYRKILEKLKKNINSKIELKYFDINKEELPLDEAAFLSKYRGKVRYFEYILP